MAMTVQDAHRALVPGAVFEQDEVHHWTDQEGVDQVHTLTDRWEVFTTDLTGVNARLVARVAETNPPTYTDGRFRPTPMGAVTQHTTIPRLIIPTRLERGTLRLVA